MIEPDPAFRRVRSNRSRLRFESTPPRVASLSLMLLLGVSFSGCATSVPTDEDAHAATLPAIHSTDTASVGAGTIDLRIGYPLEAGIERWEVVTGGRSTTQVRIRDATDRFDAAYSVRFDDRRTQYWVGAEAGVAMSATHSHGDRAISLFDPPLPIGPRELRLGETAETTVSMTVVDENRIERVRQRGKATRRVTWIDDVTVETSWGTRRAHRIETVFIAELDLARAEERATLLLVPDIGFVAEDRVETIRALGLFGRTVRQSLRRLPDS